MRWIGFLGEAVISAGMNAEAAKLPLHTAMVICKPVTQTLSLAPPSPPHGLAGVAGAWRTAQGGVSRTWAPTPASPCKKPRHAPPACREQSVALQSGGLAGWCSPTNGQRLRVWGRRGEDGGTARAAGQRSCSGESGVPEPL